jgi:hypothetical protein
VYRFIRVCVTLTRQPVWLMRPFVRLTVVPVALARPSLGLTRGPLTPTRASASHARAPHPLARTADSLADTTIPVPLWTVTRVCAMTSVVRPVVAALVGHNPATS